MDMFDPEQIYQALSIVLAAMAVIEKLASMIGEFRRWRMEGDHKD